MSEAAAASSQGTGNPGLDAFLKYPLIEAIFRRRSRRISLGIGEVPAGSLSYSSSAEPRPLEPIEEALLIAATGVTGLTTPDVPFKPGDGSSERLSISGRSASSPDNARATHFFMLNDSGTWFLKQPDDIPPGYLSEENLTAERLIEVAEKCKVRVLDHRLDFERVPPAYIGRNKYVSNLPGTTILVPVVDISKQYINTILYLLTQPDGHRPTFIDDWNFYRPAGVRKWVKSGFLNDDFPLALGAMGTFRIHIEAELLVQNVLLAIQAMGLGGWVHAAFLPPMLLGDPEFVRDYGPGLGFRYEAPKRWLWRALRFLKPLTAWRDNPVGLDGIVEGHCPPYYPTMSAAVDAVIESKYGPKGIYTDPKSFQKVFREGLAEKYLDEVPRYTDDMIACAKDVCEYIWCTYGRFPAHTDAFFAPGVWIQAHHLDFEYYDKLYNGGYNESHRDHDRLWHGTTGE